ncbi:Peptide methionine sulfoxide reductase MsrB [Bienertia sinuspersici]
MATILSFQLISTSKQATKTHSHCSRINLENFNFEEEDKIIPFLRRLIAGVFIQTKRTKIKCNNYHKHFGHVYDDGPPTNDNHRQFHFGPSQVVPRNARFRLVLSFQLISTSKQATKTHSHCSRINLENFNFEEEDKIRPFLRCLISGVFFQTKRTKIKCNNYHKLFGHVYDDGPPANDNHRQFHFGPSQVVPRNARFRLG